MTTPTGLARITSRPRRTDSVVLALDPNDAIRLAKARQAAAAAKAVAAARPDDEDAQLALLEAEEALASATAAMVTFTVHLTAIGAATAEEVVRAHPPTKEARAAARARANGDPKAEPAVNEATYPGALLSRSITRIVFSDGEETGALTESEATDLFRSLSGTDRLLVLSTAEALDVASTRVEDLGKG